MPKILYLITEDWFFASHTSHRRRVLRAKRAWMSLSRHALVRMLTGSVPKAFALSRSSRNVAVLLRWKSFVTSQTQGASSATSIPTSCTALRSDRRCSAALLRGSRRSASRAGADRACGHLWIERGFGAFLARRVTRHVIGSMLRHPQTRYLFENHEDPKEFGLDPNGFEVTIIGGAGVDDAQFPVTPEPPSPPVKFAVVARMIVQKGIAEAVDATRRARALGAPVELHLFGAPDRSNRRSIARAATLRAWGHGARHSLAWSQYRCRSRVARSPCGAFLSYREGLPRTLIEAAASGRPIVTNDVPGCREVVRDGKEGFLSAAW